MQLPREEARIPLLLRGSCGHQSCHAVFGLSSLSFYCMAPSACHHFQLPSSPFSGDSPSPHVLLPLTGAFSIEEALCPLCAQMFTGSFRLMDRNIGYVSVLITDWGWPVLTLHLHSSVLNIVSKAYLDYLSAEWRRVGSNAPDSWECKTSCHPHLPAQVSWSHPKIPASLAQPARQISFFELSTIVICLLGVECNRNP